MDNEKFSCPHCGTNNIRTNKACYSCGRSLQPQSDIPDPLMDTLRSNAPEPYQPYPREKRLLIAAATSVGCLFVLAATFLGTWWLPLLLLIFWPVTIILLAMMVIGLLTLWSWALDKK
jgi:predicted RNA-binding Zn-ribbon protein involved in translation (DUF1610 family)